MVITAATGFNYRILGDATGEMGSFEKLSDPDGESRNNSSWYNDYSHFIRTTYPWLTRGGAYIWGRGAGIFAFSYSDGAIEDKNTYRIVLTPTE